MLEDKTYMNINAKAVLICTDGFQSDQDMIKRFFGGVEVGSMYASPYYDNPGSYVSLALGSGVWAARQIAEYVKA